MTEEAKTGVFRIRNRLPERGIVHERLLTQPSAPRRDGLTREAE